MTESGTDPRDVDDAESVEGADGTDGAAASEPARRDADEGTAGDDDTFALEIWGGVVAGLGFVFTPLVTAVPASYLALKIRRTNPGAYYGILALVAATCVFWLLVVFAADLLALVLALFTGSSLLVVLLGVPVLVLLVVVAGVVYLWRD